MKRRHEKIVSSCRRSKSIGLGTSLRKKCITFEIELMAERRQSDLNSNANPARFSNSRSS